MKGTKVFKQSLAFISTVYLAFAIVFKDNIPLSRSLLEGTKSKHSNVDILIITMGERDAMSVWKERLGAIDASLTLLYASFDEVIPETKCEYEHGLICQTAFIPETTWTQGRNLLAAEALRMERRRGKEYDYWLFLDDDVDVACTGGEPMEKLLGEGSCWQKVFNFIGGDLVPENASSISLPGRPGFTAVSNSDAMFAAFKRSFVPYMLPYVTLPEGASQWSSQSALFCIMDTCLESSTVMIPYVGGRNGAHRDYARGININEIRKVIADNYHDVSVGFTPCPGGPKETHNMGGYIGPFETKDELNDRVPPAQLETCAPMKTRFETWVNKIHFY